MGMGIQDIMFGILSNNQLVWESGCYNGNYDHLCTLEDVEEFLKAEYEKAGLTW